MKPGRKPGQGGAAAPEPYDDPRVAGVPAPPKEPSRRHVAETEKQASPHLKVAKGAIRRRPHEVQATRYISSLKLDLITAELLKLHAMQRRVAMTVLISDILNLWLGVATDYSQALFVEMLPQGARAARAPERWSGYLASLGFAPSVFQDAAVPPDTDSAAQPPSAERAFPPADVPTDVRRGPGRPPLGGYGPPPENERPGPIEMTMPTPVQGSIAPAVEPQQQYVRPPVGYPQQAPDLSGLQPTGWGNAAQAFELGYRPSEQPPDSPLNRKDTT